MSLNHILEASANDIVIKTDTRTPVLIRKRRTPPSMERSAERVYFDSRRIRPFVLALPERPFYLTLMNYQGCGGKIISESTLSIEENITAIEKLNVLYNADTTIRFESDNTFCSRNVNNILLTDYK